MGKEEIAHYEQFLLFPQRFQKTCPADTYKPGLVWESINNLSQYLELVTDCKISMIIYLCLELPSPPPTTTTIFFKAVVGRDDTKHIVIVNS